MPLIKSCTVDGGNFGDDINLQLWEKLFPDLQKLRGRMHFYGIGTVLGGRHAAGMKKVVLGAGLGETGSVAKDSNWEFRWVRGPLTAKELGLPVELAIGDPAILWPELRVGHNANGPIGLIPHYATWDSFDWIAVANQAGMVAINPHQAPDQVIAEMRLCSGILTESLHGAICADAMAIPWAACILAHRFNTFKWRDWMATIQRPFEVMVTDRPLVRHISPAKSAANQLARWTQYKRHTRFPSLRPVAAATPEDASWVASELARYAQESRHFSCSDPTVIARQRNRMYERCNEFANAYQLKFESPRGSLDSLSRLERKYPAGQPARQVRHQPIDHEENFD